MCVNYMFITSNVLRLQGLTGFERVMLRQPCPRESAMWERDTHQEGSDILRDSFLGLPFAESPRSHLTTSAHTQSLSTRSPVYLQWTSLRVSCSLGTTQPHGQS